MGETGGSREQGIFRRRGDVSTSHCLLISLFPAPRCRSAWVNHGAFADLRQRTRVKRTQASRDRSRMARSQQMQDAGIYPVSADWGPVFRTSTTLRSSIHAAAQLQPNHPSVARSKRSRSVWAVRPFCMRPCPVPMETAHRCT